MILADTNIIIEFWKNPTQEVKNIFLTKKVAICGIVKAELMHGAKSPKDTKRILSALNGFDYILIDDYVWEQLGEFLYRLRKNGISIPFQDALIAILAINQNLMLWSADKHFKMIQKIFPKLQLFHL